MDDERRVLIDALKQSQAADGSWRFPFETGISTDAYMIILLRTLGIHDEPLIQALVERIESRQDPNGAWKLFADEGDGNVTATTEAYYALLYSGYRKKKRPAYAKGESAHFGNGRPRACPLVYESDARIDRTASVAKTVSAAA
ncbi:Squalene--hopene cyclase [Geobacillus sp. WSUCF1]|nr:Squalene--hopene cyclase [Geobacillus sp. WSUCF1]